MNAKNGFTLTELLISISIFSIVSVMVADLYIQSFRQTAATNTQNQVYEDSRYLLTLLSAEIQNGMIDYDEYFNQKVVQHKNYGQSYGKYYSAFFNTGDDEKLGFECNDSTANAPHRNDKNCTPKRRTIDRNTGQNPFSGKYADTIAEPEENAFCGSVLYTTDNPTGPLSPCDPDPPPQTELYLISADGFRKTILAREKIGENTNENPPEPIYALSILRLKGSDTDGDGIADNFVCADDFDCTADSGTLPRLNSKDEHGNDVLGDLDEGQNSSVDPASAGFAKDFVPISPLRVNIKDLSFSITPAENPNYAFAEEVQEQPLVTIKLTLEQKPGTAGAKLFNPVTFFRTVGAGVRTPIPSPLLVQ